MIDFIFFHPTPYNASMQTHELRRILNSTFFADTFFSSLFGFFCFFLEMFSICVSICTICIFWDLALLSSVWLNLPQIGSAHIGSVWLGYVQLSLAQTGLGNCLRPLFQNLLIIIFSIALCVIDFKLQMICPNCLNATLLNAYFIAFDSEWSLQPILGKLLFKSF